MNEEISDWLEACISLARKASDIYHALSGLFVEQRGFWRGLALDEEDHATTISLLKEFHRLGRLESRLLPDSMVSMSGTVSLAEDIMDRVLSDHLSMREAAELALSLEESAAESYMNGAVTEKAPPGPASRLKTVMDDEESHARALKEFIDESC